MGAAPSVEEHPPRRMRGESSVLVLERVIVPGDAWARWVVLCSRGFEARLAIQLMDLRIDRLNVRRTPIHLPLKGGPDASLADPRHLQVGDANEYLVPGR